MNHSCSLSSLYTSVLNVLLKKKKKQSRYPLAINITKFPDDVRLISLKSCFNVCLECQVIVLSKMNFFLMYIQKEWFSKKKSVHQFKICNHLNASQLHYPLSYLCCGFQWNVVQVFSTSLSSTRRRMQSDHHIHSWWQTWSKRMMGLWC